MVSTYNKPKALLISPPIHDFALYDLFLKPYGLLRIGKWLKDAGYSIRFINALDYNDKASEKVYGKVRRRDNGTGKFFRHILPQDNIPGSIDRLYARYGILPEVFKQKICEEKPDIVLISSGMTYWYKGVAEAAGFVKDYYPDVPVVIGGVYTTIMPEHCKKICGGDYIVEGDVYPGLIPILEKSVFPVPASKPDESYLIKYPVWKDGAVIRLNHGCTMNCDYCASRRICGGFHPGDPERSFEFLRRLYKSGINNIAFYDDALLSGKTEVFLPFLERVIESGMDLAFYTPNAVHLQFIDLYTARLMKKAGFREIRLGFESASSLFHKQYDKKFTSGQFPEAVKVLKEAGFTKEEIKVYILAGLPGQYADEVEASVRYASAFNVKVSLAEYSPVPGTAFWEKSVELSRYPIEEEPLFHNNTYFPMEWDKFTRQDLERLKKLTHSIFPVKI